MKGILGSVLLLIAVLAALVLAQTRNDRRGPTSPLGQEAPVGRIPTRPAIGQGKASAPRGPLAPDIVGDTWLNSSPLTSEDLRGKVVLVEFWTFDCINCRNTIPTFETWYDKYHDQGLIIIGVHTPEFTFEHDVANVKQAIRDLRIPYAVVLDNDFKTWNAYHVYAWPTWFVLDKQGTIRFSHIGEGAYAQMEQIVVQLLHE